MLQQLLDTPRRYTLPQFGDAQDQRHWNQLMLHPLPQTHTEIDDFTLRIPSSMARRTLKSSLLSRRNTDTSNSILQNSHVSLRVSYPNAAMGVSGHLSARSGRSASPIQAARPPRRNSKLKASAARSRGVDVVLSSGFLAFAKHAGFLKAVDKVTEQTYTRSRIPP